MGEMRVFVLQVVVFAMVISLVDLKPDADVSKQKCPTNLSVCTCEPLPNGTFHVAITCTNIKSDQQLKKDMETLKGVKMDAITLRGLNLWPWPKDVFAGLYVEFLIIQDSLLPKLIGPDKESILKGLEESLQYLELNNLNAKVLKWSRLNNMKSLKILKVIGTPIKKLYKSISSVANGKLNSVAFIGNNMTKINKHALQHLPNVIEIQIEKNQLTKVHRTMFPNPANKLRIFSLESNQLTDLPSDLFSNMPKLEFLSVKDNLLHVISADAFKPLFSQIKLLIIGGNPLNCDCNLQWLLKAAEKFQGGSDFMTTTCETPAKLHNQTLLSLSAKSLTC